MLKSTIANPHCSAIPVLLPSRWGIYEKQVKNKFASPAHLADLMRKWLRGAAGKPLLLTEPCASKVSPCQSIFLCNHGRTRHMVPLKNKSAPLLASFRDISARNIWIVVVLLLSLCPVPASGQEKALNKPLVASGLSPIIGKDSADSRSLALEEALRAAVEQALGYLLPAQNIVHYYPLLLNRVLKEPMNYVKDYQIVQEAEVSGLYRVTVQTTLYSENLIRDLRRLGMFLATSERPRVAILVAERTSPDEPWRWWWQIGSVDEKPPLFLPALSKLMAERGLVPLAPTLLSARIPQDANFQVPLLDEAQGAALAKALAADVAVLGQVSYRATGMGETGMTSGSLHAVRTDSGQTLARVSATVQVQPSTQQSVTDYGFTALAERLAPHLVDGILAPYAAVSRAPRDVSLQVEGVRSYGDLIIIKEYLQRSPVIKEIRQIKLKGDLGSFALILTEKAKSLEEALQGQDFGTFVTSAELMGENVIRVSILSKR